MGVEVTEPVAEAVPVVALRARSLTIPTDRPEADKTLSWNRTSVLRPDEAERVER